MRVLHQVYTDLCRLHTERALYHVEVGVKLADNRVALRLHGSSRELPLMLSDGRQSSCASAFILSCVPSLRCLCLLGSRALDRRARSSCSVEVRIYGYNSGHREIDQSTRNDLAVNPLASSPWLCSNMKGHSSCDRREERTWNARLHPILTTIRATESVTSIAQGFSFPLLSH